MFPSRNALDWRLVKDHAVLPSAPPRSHTLRFPGKTRLRSAPIVAAVFLQFFGCGCRQDSSAAIRLRQLDGKSVAPLSATDASVTVFFFVAPDCPIANRYAPEIARLHEKFSPRGVKFWVVYPGTNDTVKDITQHLRDFRIPCDALLDPDLDLAKAARVRVTPEAAVFTPAQGLRYHGRIDDLFADFGVKRPAPTRRDLEDTLDALLAGKQISASSTPAIGCRIPGLN